VVSVTVKNLFVNLPTGTAQEEFLTLLESGGARVERIVSRSHRSPPGFWYDPDDDEWVLVVVGSATLEFASGELVELKAGDYVTLARHAKHRVARTSEEMVWLAVHVK
jgi:cupin 2 domain-containing protein